MSEKELQEVAQQIKEIHQAIYGIPGTESKGICGDIKGLKALYSRVTRLEVVFYGGGAIALVLFIINILGVKL